MSVKDMVKSFGNEAKPAMPGPKPLLGPKPFEKPKSLPRTTSKPNSNGFTNNSTTGSLFSNNDIQKKLSQIQSKRTPPPPVPNQASTNSTTPEFLRRPLKKVTGPHSAILQREEESNNEKSDSKNNSTTPSPKGSPKVNIRNSILLFEQNLNAKPEVKPKPRSSSRVSNSEHSETEKKQDKVANEVTNSAPTSIKETDQVSSASKSFSNLPSKGKKPTAYTLCDIPKGLEEWIQKAISENSIKGSSLGPAPPVFDRSNKPSVKTKGVATTNIPVSGGYSDELYDDVGATLEGEDLYDDACLANQYEAGEELYDDVETIIPTLQGDNANGEELYDDALDLSNQNVNNKENIGTQQNKNALIEEELYDDVEGGTQVSGQMDDEFGGADGEQIYEPVESSKIYVDSLMRKQTEEAANETKEDKKLKKERLKEEKKKKKEEQEKRKKEDQERKKQEKERKQFNLKTEGEILPLERHITVKEYKGRGKELSFGNGELVDIISKENCPKGKWLARSMDGRLGYLSLKSIGLEAEYERTPVSQSTSSTPSVADDDLLYEEVGKDAPPPVPLSPRPVLSPNLPSVGGEEIEEDVYEAI